MIALTLILFFLSCPVRAQTPEAWKDWPPDVFDLIEPVSMLGILDDMPLLGPVRSAYAEAYSAGLARALAGGPTEIRPPLHTLDPLAALGEVSLAGLSLPTIDGVDEIGPMTTLDLRALTGAADEVNNEGRLRLAQLRAGQVTPEAKEWLCTLDKPRLMKLAESIRWRDDDHAASDAVMETLVERHGLADAKTSDLPYGVALRLGHYFSKRGDERCVAIYGCLLTARTRSRETNTWLPELYALGMYYRQRGDYERAIEWFRRADSYTADPDIVADFEIEAIRVLAVWSGRQAAIAEYERLLDSPLQAHRLWVVIGDLADCNRRDGRVEEAERLLRLAADGGFGPEVAFLALRARADLTRVEAASMVDRGRRTEGYRRALLFYERGLRALQSSELSVLPHPVQRTAAEAQQFVEYLRARVGNPVSRAEDTS